LEEGGLLSLAPFEVGCGARFDLAWPLDDQGRGEDAPVRSPRTLRPAQLDGMRVAVLEDDAAIVELLDTVLVARGATITAVPNVTALRAALGADRIDVALVDASPLGSTLESTLESLKREFPRTDLVLISGSPDPGASAERLAVTWIRKPFEVAEVVEVLRLVRVRGSSRPGT
jgi:DNA-binding NtrC family response regulator